MSTKTEAWLVFEDGTFFRGLSFGARGERTGEVVFNTSLTGYQEILTDPSYAGQFVLMTYPEIGNYGVNTEDVESRKPFLEGFIVRHYNAYPSNFRSRQPLHRYLEKHKIPAIEGIDTRAITRHLRDHGSQMAILSTETSDKKKLLKKLKESPHLVGQDLVKKVTCKKPYHWTEGTWLLGKGYSRNEDQTLPYKVVAYDFGIKRNILRNLIEVGCDVTVVPATTTAEEVLAYQPQGVFLSNGPGDPEPVTYAIENIRKLHDRLPVFGICLGHQLLGLAMGARSGKLKFGHHGGNHPVMDLKTRRVEITSQNHGFVIDTQGIEKEMQVTHINLNDKTVEGYAHTKLPLFSVQYHPEASPGPHDSRYLFHRFVEYMKGNHHAKTR